MADEYIERGALLAAYDKEHEGEPGRARKLIEDAPAADVVQVVRGKWEKQDANIVWNDVGLYAAAYKCNRCGELNIAETNYCPNCGAKMDGET